MSREIGQDRGNLQQKLDSLQKLSGKTKKTQNQLD
jgi:hypothetical protein